MSKNTNNVVLVGTVGNVEINDEKNFAKISIAINEKYKDKEGSEQTKTTWHNITSFKLDSLEEVNKGVKVLVKGKLDQTKYQDKDGIEQTSTSIIANNIEKTDTNLNIKPQQNIELAGNLTQEPKIITSKDGKEFASITIANNSVIKLKEGQKVPKGYTLSSNSKEWASKPNFINVSVFDEKAVQELKQKTKGQRLSLKGVLESNTYQDKEGKTRHTLQAKVLQGQKIEFVEKAKSKDKAMDR